MIVTLAMLALLGLVLWATLHSVRQERKNDDPWAPIVHLLLVTHDGRVPTDEERSAAFDAAVSMAGAMLVQSGVSLDEVERLFCDRDVEVKLTYVNNQVNVTIDWKDDCDVIRVTSRTVVPTCDEGGCAEPAKSVCSQCTLLLCPRHGGAEGQCDRCGDELVAL